jgi:hypothetical protein
MLEAPAVLSAPKEVPKDRPLPANLMKTKEIHHPTSVCSVALCMIRGRGVLLS